MFLSKLDTILIVGGNDDFIINYTFADSFSLAFAFVTFLAVLAVAVELFALDLTEIFDEESLEVVDIAEIADIVELDLISDDVDSIGDELTALGEDLEG